ncbi:hypothetical protein BDV59DRAFT_205367 [Aspergillus ambiguus]|uniref:uncharacterized protein n=1 Tax=Aspergillus ambiguus TaxID=176160 RepID=UPI003CCD6296
MERLPGQHLYRIWDGLLLDHKKAVLDQIAAVLNQMAMLKFDEIGSLQEDGLGPFIHLCLPTNKEGTYKSTLDFLCAFIDEKSVESLELKTLYGQIKETLENFFTSPADASYFHPPFRLIHPDFDAQNLLFVKPADNSEARPCLSGVIDFEYAHTGPLYYLYEYPIFIQDVDFSPELYEENAVLRPYFARALRQGFPKGSPDAIAARNAMRDKTFILNEFKRVFTSMKMPESIMEIQAATFLQQLEEGTGHAYTGRPDYVPDPELWSDDEET